MNHPRRSSNPTTGRHRCRLADVATVRLFASAREAAGVGADVFDEPTVDDVLRAAEIRYGPRFRDVLASCRVWLNGDDAPTDAPVGPHDEVAVLPPVSGGCS